MMLGVEMLREFVASVILTGRLKNYDPVSALLVAAPESGKTSIIVERSTKNVWPLTDVTGRGLIDICKNRPEISHLALLDLVTIMSHKKSVNSYTFGILNSMTEEGIRSIALPGTIETFDHGRRAILGAITADLSEDKRRWWHKQGFTSRMLPFCYTYSDQLVIKIKGRIEKGKEKEPSKLESLRVPEVAIFVACNEKYAREIRHFSDLAAAKMQEIGIRRLKQFLGIASGHALLRNWKNAKIAQVDIDFIERILPHISFDKPVPLM